MCLARCLVVGRFIANHGRNYYRTKGYKTLVDNRCCQQTKDAKELQDQTGVSPERECDLDDIDVFQAVMPDYSIFVYQSNGSMDLIYPTEPDESPRSKRIYLWLHDHHFSLIQPFQVAGFLGSAYYCHKCHRGRNRLKHACSAALCKFCRLAECQNRNSEPTQEPEPCNDCNRIWRTKECKVAHAETLCQRECKCPICWKIVARDKLEPPELHKCLLNLCQYCGEHKPPGHIDCFIQRPKYNLPEEEEESLEPDVQMAEDILCLLNGGEDESDSDAQSEAVEGNKRPKRQMMYSDIESEVDRKTLNHTPILLCIVNEKGDVMNPYKGEQCVDQFIKDLLEKDEFKNKCIVYHNLSGYDGMFLLRGFFKQALDPNAIFRASKVLTMQLKQRNIRFLDSFLHLAMPLKRMPYAYNYAHKIVKGHFAVLFPSPETRGYVGDLPDKYYYDRVHSIIDCFIQRPKYNLPEEEEESLEPDVQMAEDILCLLNGGEDESDSDAQSEAVEGNKRPKRQMMYSDIESEVDRKTLDHTPILLCIVNEKGDVMNPYKGEQCVDQFIKDLLEKDEFKNKCIVYHNLSGYDGMFLLRGFFKQALDPNAIFRASKVLTMQLKQRNIRFLDSFLHLAMPLKRMPYTYNYAHKIVKGHFAVLFPSPETRGYVGDLPDKYYYDREHKSEKDAHDLDVWYAEKRREFDNDPNLHYDLEAEMIKYCIGDCQCLRMGFEEYRATFKGDFRNVDPAEALTLPSLINHCYRAMGMPKDSIPVLPPRGFNSSRNQSKEAIYYMEWEAKSRNLYIRHTRNSRSEVKIGPYYCDGWHDPQNGEPATVWEYYGCLFHGCVDCYPNDRDEIFKGKTFRQRYEETLEKEQFIREKGYTLITMWACHFKAMRAHNTVLDEFLKGLEKYKHQASLSSREALRGGRTNSIRLSYTPKPGESIQYVDFTWVSGQVVRVQNLHFRSLYPACQVGVRGQEFPVGFPKVYLHSYPPQNEWFGLAKVVIEPPKRLLHPVLPICVANKVLFSLCGTCSKEGNNKRKCRHRGKQRYITDSFVTVELLKALELGYKIKETIELWQWEERSKELFSDFIKKAYARKVAASGWPKQYVTEEQRRDYLRRYKEEQGIDIAYESVQENKALRENSKLLINNCWGYFGKDANAAKTFFVSTYAGYLKLLRNKTLEIKATYLVNEKMMAVECTTAEAFLKPDPKTCTPLTCFTTAYARLQLYEQLEILGDLVLYFDTDSVIYIVRPGRPVLKVGDLLGDLTNEVLQKYGPRAEIASFHSGGPKMYLLDIRDCETKAPIDAIMKHKGLRASVGNSHILNPTNMAQMIEQNTTLEVPQMNFVRNRKVGSVVTRYMDKRLRVTFRKRIVPDSIDAVSLPIGYQD